MATMTKNLKWYLFLIFLFQIIIASSFELAHDEAYYWLYSKYLDWGYFDHPPLVALIIRAFSFMPHSELAVRLGFIFIQFLSLFVLIWLTRVPAVTILLFFSFPLASFSGLLAIPDMPLLFMTTLYCWQLKKYLKHDSHLNSTMLGIVIALTLYAKYHGILLVLFTLLAIPKIFKRKSFYLVTLVSIFTFAPHIFWQVEHDFSTIRYHFFERPRSNFNFTRLIEYFGIQIGLAGVLVGPLVWQSILKNKTSDAWGRALKFISIGSFVFFFISGFSKKIEANWTIFLVSPLILLAARDKNWHKKNYKSLLWGSFTFVLIARLLLVIPPEVTGIKRLKEFHGWQNFADQVYQECNHLPMIANSYQVASKLSFYLDYEIGSLNYKSRRNQFDIWNFQDSIPTQRVCYLTDKKEFQGKEMNTPDGKIVRVIKNVELSGLQELKLNIR